MAERLRACAPYATVLLLAIGLYWMATHFDYSPRTGRLGPDAWPRAILGLIIAVCAARIVGALRRPADPGVAAGMLPEAMEAAAADAGAAEEPEAPRHPALVWLGVAITVAYVFLLPWLGFAIDTAVYLAAMIRAGRYRRWRVILPTAIAGSLSLMFVFMKIVYLSLPIGRPPFESVSLALMQLMGIR